MCGRARLLTDYSEIKIRLKFAPDAPAPNYDRNFNLAITEKMLVAIRSEEGRRVPQMMRWGLIPHWAKDEKIGYSTHNARSETFTTLSSFRDAWKWGQRCLVVTDGFYEWKKLEPDKPKGKKQAYAIGMAGEGQQMVMAGLWSKWKNRATGEEIVSCTILTCEPNAAIGELHDRMPVILGEAAWSKWLGEEPASDDELLALLRPCPNDWLKTWMVDNKVGSVRNKGDDLLLPI
jgi:putative SOS response-associated peptidase YedK